MRSKKRLAAAAALLSLGVAGVATAGGVFDFGLSTQNALSDKSEKLFGVDKPIAASSTLDLDQAGALANPAGLVTVAKGLKVRDWKKPRKIETFGVLGALANGAGLDRLAAVFDMADHAAQARLLDGLVAIWQGSALN
mgnify:CR=1 FL=1